LFAASANGLSADYEAELKGGWKGAMEGGRKGEGGREAGKG